MCIPTDPIRRKRWVIDRLKERGLSLAQLGEQAGVSRVSVRRALLEPSHRLELVIANALGVNVEELFPERFYDGHRIHRIRQGEGTRSRTDAHVRNGVAA